MFCSFKTTDVGICGKYVGTGINRCKKHLAMTEVKKVPQKKFRGDSKFSKSEGLWTNK